MIEKTEEGWIGKAQVDASDRREIVLPDNSRVTTTCLLKGEFDILAVNVFAFGREVAICLRQELRPSHI